MIPMKLNLAQVRDDLPSLTGCNLTTGRSILGVSTRRLDILLQNFDLVREQVTARVIVRCECKRHATLLDAVTRDKHKGVLASDRRMLSSATLYISLVTKVSKHRDAMLILRGQHV